MGDRNSEKWQAPQAALTGSPDPQLLHLLCLQPRGPCLHSAFRMKLDNVFRRLPLDTAGVGRMICANFSPNIRCGKGLEEQLEPRVHL